MGLAEQQCCVVAAFTELIGTLSGLLDLGRCDVVPRYVRL